MKNRMPLQYAFIGALLIPVFGRLALTGTGHEGDLYRYAAPIFVGYVGGFILGWVRKKWLDKVEELSQARDLLFEQEEKYREIYNAPGEPVIVYSVEKGNFLEVNNAMLEVYGYTPEQALELTVDDISEGSYPCNTRGFESVVRRAFTRGAHTFEWHSRKKNGELFWTEITLKRAHFNNKDFLIAAIRDIDARKKAEIELVNEKERLSVTLRSIGDGVITTDIDGNIVFLNKVAEQLTGWSSDEAAGKPSTEVFNIINEKTGAHCTDPVQKVLQLGMITGLSNHTALIARDGTERSIADSGAPIRNRESETIGVVLVFRDVTHEKMIEEELLRVKKLESIGVLAGGLAHDFNNILAAILGNIELASFRISEHDAKAAALLADAQKATRRAAKLTDQLLTFARGGDPVREKVSLPELITESAEFVLHGSNVVCEYDFPDNLRNVDVDSGQISQVIQNIILNAKHAMPEGGAVAVHCANIEEDAANALLNIQDSKFVCITLQDQGMGISEELINRIFDPYFTTKQEGHGLGLAICHSIINKHGGYLSVDSTPGKGTCFTLYLPAVRSTEEKTDEPAAAAVAVRSVRVLLMDDDDMIRTVGISQLKTLGHETVLATDGEQAVQLYQEFRDQGKPIDVMIMDLTIAGGMGGKEAVQKVLAIDPEARAIVASGYSNDPVMAKYREHGFRAVVVKPFSMEELASALEAALR
jgi:PAS domain S-box-containing protein